MARQNPGDFMSGKLSKDRGTPRPVPQVLGALVRHPVEMVVSRWNWKAALLSSILRSLIFFGANLRAGWHAAFAAFVTELVFRGLTSGFYGALTEAFRFADPDWAAFLVAAILLPVVGHSAEFAVHLARGTARLKTSVVASITFTAVSTLFNLYAMRRGALVTGDGRQSLAADMKRMPRLIASFLAAGPRAVWRLITRKCPAVPVAPLAPPDGVSD